MFLKLLLIVALLYVLYRIFGGKIELPFNKEKLNKYKEQKEIDQNTLVECCNCSIYITKKEAKKKGDCYYCEDCA